MIRVALMVFMMAVMSPVAWGQMSYEQAMARLRERQAAREQAGESATTAPAAKAAVAERVRATAEPVADEPPAAPREFRAAWVASVDNSQWPSKTGLTVEQQKQEMLTILDRCAALRINAIVFQVRPCADALYVSSLEPWSEYMTGTQGKPPEPLWDPLQAWVEEAHKRGMELHAWFNPYRVKHAKSTGPIADTSIAKTHPEVVRQYGGYLWMDPGEPVAARQTLDVIADIVKRYDVDGVHTDDYYYPYKAKENGKEVEFPDDVPYQKYRGAGGTLARDDWRRENVNQLVEQIYKTVHGIKPWVKVGYAPFGIWKSGVPAGIKGMSMYDGLYADAKLWLNKGWLDYISPQLYWKIGGDQDYVALLKWWASENTAHRHVWPGLSAGRHPLKELTEQIALTHQAAGTSAGVILWHVNSVLRRQEIYDGLGKGPYAQGALVPASPWLGRAVPKTPSVTAQKVEKGAVSVALAPGAGDAPSVYGVWARRGGEWSFVTVPGGSTNATLDPGAGGEPVSAVVVTAVDRCGNESERVKVPVQ